MVQPSAYEQYMLELVNRARLNPETEADLFGIDLNEGLDPNTISSDPKQPLAFNLLLIDSAIAHSQWMLDTDTFSHTGAGESDPGDRMRDAGYNFTGSWGWGENIAWRGTTGTLDVTNAVANRHEGLFKSSGHRTNILNNNFREIGISTLTGEYSDYNDLGEYIDYNALMVTQNFAKSGASIFMTGVAFDDLVINDDFYTVGEGLGGITVTATRQSDNQQFSTTTMDAGGYQMALSSGTYNVSFSDNGQTIGSTQQVDIGSQNVKLDLNTDNLVSLQNIGEVGRINNLNHHSQTIQLNGNYTNPVVFALPLSYNGADPAIARITDIQNDSFSVYLQEPEYRDGRHGRESFSYVVLEIGTWELADGTILEVGTVNTNSTTVKNWETIDFSSDFQETPVILSQVQTDAGSQFVRTRQKSASVDGFELAMEEEEALKSSGHARETVGWLAIESGEGSWGSLEYEAGHTGTNINHNWGEINFSQNFDEAPNLLASISSYNGGDPSGLRSTNLGSSQVQIKIEEDRSLDSEIYHINEMVDFLAIAGTGDLMAMAYDPMSSF